MKRIAWGIVLGGATAAAFVGSATANATGDTWTPNYDLDNAELFVGPTLNSPAWELPASFTSGTGADATTLTGHDYIWTTAGGFDNEFVTDDGSILDQDQLGGGFTNLYYQPAANGAAVEDVMKTPFGDFDISSLGSLFAPSAFENFASAATVGHNVVLNDGVSDHLAEALALANNDVGGLWQGGPTDQSVITAMQAPDSSLVWSVPATFTTTLTGTEYVTSPNHAEFVTNSGAIFDWDRLSSGFLGVDNLYYDPVGGPAQDYLQTAFGTFDLSSIASWFAPADVSDLVAASPVSDLSDAGLYSVLDLAAGLSS